MAPNPLAISVTFQLLLVLFQFFSPPAAAHGGVMIEDDLCIIRIGYLKAHFTVYQPAVHPDTEFCEDLPDAALTRFMLEFQRKNISGMPVDFRIVRDSANLGRFATLEDVLGMKDFEASTVLYQPPRKQTDPIYQAEYEFDEPGAYIGIVTAGHPTRDIVYQAVFPFEVATGSRPGYVHLLILLGILIELGYLYSNGTLSRWIERIRGSR